DVPLLAAFEDGALLAFDFLAGGLVDLLFVIKQVFQDFADLQTYRIAIFDEVDFAHLSQRIADHVRDLVNLVPAEPQWSSSASVLRATARPYTFAPTRSSLCGTFPGNWRRCCAFPRSRLRG